MKNFIVIFAGGFAAVAILIAGCSNTGTPDTFRISSVSPVSSCSLGPVTISRITGTGFTTGTEVVLRKSGETDITASNVVWNDSTWISCEFNITGAATGNWNVVVRKGSNESILSEGFEVSNARYVSTTGDDGNAGTASQPMASVSAAVAASSSGQEVRVSEGSYLLTHSTRIIVKNGVSILGGYDSTTWKRDISENRTTIRDRSAGTTLNNDYPFCVFHIDSSVQSSTLIEGFEIRGSNMFGPDYTSGIFLDNFGSSNGPTIRNNWIDGGSGSENSYGIYMRGVFSTIIDENDIDGGNGANYSYGIYGRMLGTTRMQNNLIDGGGGSLSTGIFFRQGSDPVICNNIIYGGDGMNSRGIDTFNNSGNTVLIRNNNIDGGLGDGGSSRAIHIRNSTPAIQNNILFSTGNTNQYGIYEYDASSDPVLIENNNIFNCNQALYFDEGSTALTTIASVNSTIAEATDNISVDPLFVDPASGDFHCTAVEVVAGLNGIDEAWTAFPSDSSGNPVDNHGVLRPGSGNPWTIGALE